MSERGIYGKYVISKADGSEIDPEACYFVLRLDTDGAARKAMGQYARSCRKENPLLAERIRDCVSELENGRGGYAIFSDIWRHGGKP